MNLYMLLDGNMMDIEPEGWTGIVGTDLDTYPAISWFIFVAEWTMVYGRYKELDNYGIHGVYKLTYN